MDTSPYLEEASELLEKARARPMNPSDRQRQAIELSGLLLKEASRCMTRQERDLQEQLSRLMKDPFGKAFTTAMTDECFRSTKNSRIADQMIHLLQQFGIPQYLNWFKRLQLYLFRSLGINISRFLVPLAARSLRSQTSRVILPGETNLLTHHLQERKKEGVRLNLNHLGEAILSEKEAKKRLQIYLDDLKNPDIDYISVKISTIFSQINLLAFNDTVDFLAERLKLLYRAAMQYPVELPDKKKRAKFINLDMEEYRDLRLTVAVFQKVLDEPEFQEYSAGIVLQAYLPDSHHHQIELTQWAKKRVQSGGAPIKIRIVKGANLAMEQFEASLRGWPQAPYQAKDEVDANYKKMVIYGCIPENARAVRIGVASHNLFDISFAMLLRVENEVESYVGFEMLEGMADHIRRTVQKLTGDILLYCPVATKQEFQHAIAYLIRRLDENTGPENFLRHVFGLKPGTEAWDAQSSLFIESCQEIKTVFGEPRRTQNRLLHPVAPDPQAPFDNEPDTDFSLPQNQQWAKEISHHWKQVRPKSIPLVINGKELYENEEGIGINPSDGGKPFYRYAKAHKHDIEAALKCAKAHEKAWAATTVEHRSHLLERVAQKLRERRGELIGVMMIDAGKTVLEGDPEVSEAIDFAEYYRRRMLKMTSMKDLSWRPKGTVLVTPPWNFPCSIPAGGILAALITGNCVILKPASDAVLVAWHLVQAFWDAGISKEVLQFIPCSGEGVGSELVRDPRVNCIVLTGGTSTARSFLKMRPGIDLAAETGGKNAMIITGLSDRDLAIKDLIQSAFGHSGQKCSAASLAILEAEVYDDPHFLRHLREAAASLKVGPAWDLNTKINPLIHEPKGVLKKALTTLEDGEEWLLEPKQDPTNPCLWSPGIKLHVQPGGFTHMTELFGPVLGLIRANNLQHAIELANATPYGLTSGIHSLDDREQNQWLLEIDAGNLYINRTITGAIVRRQPFGGTKASNFGNGSKAGGPNYLREFLHVSQVGLPREKHPVNQQVNNLTAFLEKFDLTAEQLGLWTASVSNYAYWWKRLQLDRDPTKIVGQDNFFHLVARNKITMRVYPHSHPLDVLRVAAAALTCGTNLEISWDSHHAKPDTFNWLELVPILCVVEEKESDFLNRIRFGQIERVRLVEEANPALHQAASESGIHIIDDPVLVNGRVELLHYLREVAISIDYHRYGNLGMREGELRKPIL